MVRRTALLGIALLSGCMLFPSLGDLVGSAQSDAGMNADVTSSDASFPDVEADVADAKPSDATNLDSTTDAPADVANETIIDAGPTFTIYADTLAAGWLDGSWSSTVDLASTAHVASGKYAIAWTVTYAYGGFFPYSNAGFDTTPYNALEFELELSAATSGLTVGGEINGNVLNKVALASYGVPLVGQWTLFRIPLTDLGLNGQVIDGVMIQDGKGQTEPTVYLDDINFTQ